MKILVPTDGSEYSKRALEMAKEIGSALNAEITILNVMNPAINLRTMQNKAFYEEINKGYIARSREILDNALKEFADYKGKVQSLNKIGDPVDEIINLAEEERYNLVIMGSRGAGIFSRTLLGSVSDKVIHYIKTSVLIVK